MFHYERWDKDWVWALYVAFKVVAFLWIYTNLHVNTLLLHFSLVWLLALAMTQYGWMKGHKKMMNGALILESLGLLLSVTSILMGIFTQWRYGSRQLTPVEADILVRMLGITIFALLAVKWLHSKLLPDRVVDHSLSGRMLFCLQAGLWLYFLWLALNRLRFVWESVDLYELIILNSLCLSAALLSAWGRVRPRRWVYGLLAMLDLVIVGYPLFYMLCLSPLPPLPWNLFLRNVMVLYLPFLYCGIVSIIRMKELSSRAGHS